ncbi:hypothetical protein STEG23_036934, partial [Scotinomys teguina]
NMSEKLLRSRHDSKTATISKAHHSTDDAKAGNLEHPERSAGSSADRTVSLP